MVRPNPVFPFLFNKVEIRYKEFEILDRFSVNWSINLNQFIYNFEMDNVNSNR